MWFSVVSVTVMVAPATALMGAESADTMRSGCAAVSGILTVVESELALPVSKTPTERLPRSLSPGSNVASVEK